MEVASTYPEVALYVNDKLVGTRKTGREQRFMAEFEIPYTPGTLRAVAMGADGLPADTAVLETAGRPVAVRLVAEPAAGDDLVFVRAEIVDSKGRVVPVADNMLSFSVSGDAAILATGSADPTDSAGYTRHGHKAYHGRALCIVRRNGDNGALTAKSPGLKPAQLNF